MFQFTECARIAEEFVVTALLAATASTILVEGQSVHWNYPSPKGTAPSAPQARLTEQLPNNQIRYVLRLFPAPQFRDRRIPSDGR